MDIGKDQDKILEMSPRIDKSPPGWDHLTFDIRFQK